MPVSAVVPAWAFLSKIYIFLSASCPECVLAMGLPGRPEAKTLKVLPRGGSLASQKGSPAGAAGEGAPERWASRKVGGCVWAVAADP